MRGGGVLSLAINSLEQFAELMVLAGLHRGTCCRERGVGRVLPGYRAENTRLYTLELKEAPASRFAC